jgi:hypothetical protein
MHTCFCHSVVTVCTGISFERLIRYHQWFAVLAVIPMTIHGLNNGLLMEV